MTSAPSNALDVIRGQGVVAIVRARTADDAASTVDALLEAGIRAVEVSLVTPNALDVVRAAAAAAPDDVAVGVGTVLSVNDVTAAVTAGARFIVAPAFDASVVQAAIAAGIDVLPGVATPTEAVTAVAAGATAVKVFPASLWSPAVLREVRTALPWLTTVPTGGVSLETAPEWIRAGAAAVGIGSALTGSANPGATAARLLDAIHDARTGT
ncbi:2-dehydro-3-deoxyphosphogluconate aldolase/(4S)-4-hydroxy-2-oxoglutarate aldolase [Microbacterium sp. AK009]|uniref:bifunctional 4-hydroxy-2-oxoglutarate aldolase/2-dehydro-3-deoxy-phosphogluconate aldolase n=1 Tax=Microbacterium sp. AK009 TaxID=2723068 RepID=UPI0015C9D278|nr:bifunctional 4-hydroxy-2-oxoglutarate aldolase/2-dehydro-3-deoxy-phosphogluconate aldolase [Microbacterium sp. AK009]NYF16552.1 2-dehydro-3-deoxyphosphogluconate aldolase/(4S)-4-hydroxy-2-oxoglutarate aldolase [Microbacterium sp. AK009]